jgi:hypothetical protein
VHGATLTVRIAWDDKGVRRTGEAQMRVNGNIRSDIVFQPGAVQFEGVDQGLPSQQNVQVTYAGRSNWQIMDVRGASDHLEVELLEKQRASGRVAYDLLVRLKGTAPAGYLNEHLVLVTNDERNPRIPLHVAGRVVPEISVAPAPLVFGEVSRGEQISKRVIVRGKKPFRIVSVDSDEKSFQFKTDDQASDRHIIEIVFAANRDAGHVKQTIRIATDLGESYHATLTAHATVVPEVTNGDDP